MNRRTALKQVIVLSAGTALLGSCKEEKPSLDLKNLSLTAAGEKTVAALSNAIIPATKDFYGAAEIKAHEFTLMMVDECESPEVQKVYMEGLQAFTKKVNKDYGSSFEKLNREQQDNILIKLEAKNFGEEEIQNFYSITKTYTVRAFTSSSKYMTQVRKYKMVPGSNFRGCVSAV